MAVVKRGKKWRVRIRNHQGGWWNQTCHSKATALAAEREMLEARDRGLQWLHPRDRVGDLTLRAVAETYIRARRTKLAQRTLVRYAHELEAFVTWCEARHRPLASQLRRADLRAYHDHISENGRFGRQLKPVTANKVLNTVMHLWSWAKEHDDEYEGWEAQVPAARRIELPSVSPPVTVAPTWEEMDALIHQLRDVEFCRRAAWMQRFTAMRIGETMALRWERVDLESGLLILDPEITKGGYGGRTLPIASALAEEMRGWSRPGPWICGGEEPRYSSTNRPSRKFLNAWKRTGVREIAWRGQPTHALRKGVISGLHALGAHPDAVEVLAGHSLGLRGAYLDRRIAFDLRGVVELLPPLH